MKLHSGPIEPQFFLSATSQKSIFSPSSPEQMTAVLEYFAVWREGEMDEPNKPSSQGVSSRVPVDHCRCQWPRHQCFITAPQWFCCRAGNQDQSPSTATVTRDRRRPRIKHSALRSASSPHINNPSALFVFCAGAAISLIVRTEGRAHAGPLLHISLLYMPFSFASVQPLCCTSQLERPLCSFINGRSESINQLVFCWQTDAVIGILAGGHEEVGRRGGSPIRRRRRRQRRTHAQFYSPGSVRRWGMRIKKTAAYLWYWWGVCVFLTQIAAVWKMSPANGGLRRGWHSSRTILEITWRAIVYTRVNI